MNTWHFRGVLLAALFAARCATAQQYEQPGFLPSASLQALASARPLPRLQPIPMPREEAIRPAQAGPMRLVRLPNDSEPKPAPASAWKRPLRTWFDAPARGIHDAELLPRARFLFLEPDPFGKARRQ